MLSVAHPAPVFNPRAVNWNSQPEIYIRRADLAGYYVEAIDHGEGRLWVANRELLDREEAQTLADSLGATLAEVARQKRIVSAWDGFEENLRMDRAKAEALAGRLSVHDEQIAPVATPDREPAEEQPRPDGQPTVPSNNDDKIATEQLPTRQQLSPLVDAAVASLHCGARAVKAAELVAAGEVSRRPDWIRRNGRRQIVERQDRWQVHGYQVSVSGKFCDCPDACHNAPRHNGAPLCKHRLAAMYLMRLEEQAGVPRGPQPVQRLAQVLAQAHEQDSPCLRLYVRVYYTYEKATEQRNVLVGYLVEGPDQRQMLFDKEQELTFTFGHLESALSAAGWQYRTKNRMKAYGPDLYQECWYLSPQAAQDANLRPELATHIDAVAA